MANPVRPEFGCFVTGTDTGVGKTWVCAGLLHALALRGRRVAGMKPVASGAESGPDGLRNADALLLQSQCTSAMDYADVNPYALRDPIAPHIAAERDGVRIRIAPILAAYRRLCAHAEAVVVEGIGGWRVPLSRRLQTADLVRALDVPVILVVGLRPGCINHALLTAECMAKDGVRLAGWVANTLDPAYEPVRATLEHLRSKIDAPLLGQIGHLASADAHAIGAALDLKLLPEV